MDLLSDILTVTGVRGTLGARIEGAEGWGVRWTPTPGSAVVYAVAAGTAWLTVPGHDPRRLMPGDAVLLPSGGEHDVSGAPGLRSPECDHVAAELARGKGEVIRLGEGEAGTHILGASYEYDHAMSTQVLATLPTVVHVRADHVGTCLDDTVRLLAREMAHPQMATAVVLDRLVDVLLVQLLRVWLLTRPEEAGDSWLRVLGDPLVTDALTRLHREPGRAWTTDALAAELSVSRATLSRRFLAAAGMAPGAYLTRWRMDLAARRLRDTDEPLETIAHAVGYTSVHAFSRAFSRSRAVPPGRFRALAREHADRPAA
jgi:AraC-like DNA-binding protein